MALDKLTSNAMKQTSLPEKAKISQRYRKTCWYANTEVIKWFKKNALKTDKNECDENMIVRGKWKTTDRNNIKGKRKSCALFTLSL